MKDEKQKERAGDAVEDILKKAKKQVKDITREAAESVNQPFVTERWVGGMLTNSSTVNQQIKKLKNLEKRMSTGELEKRYSKLEVQRYAEEIEDMDLKYGGIKDLMGKPGILFATDAIADANAIREAKTLNIPVVAIVDTNVNPDGIDFVIPANDDAIKGVKLILDYVVAAVQEGAADKKEATTKK